MDERSLTRKTGREPQKTQKKQDYVFFVTLMQLLGCTLVFLLLLLLSRGNSARAQGLKQDFEIILSRQLQMQDVGGTVAAVRDFFMSETGSAAVTAEPDETTGAEAENREPEDDALSASESDETQALSAKSLQTSAAIKEQQTKLLPVGGEDAAKQKEQNTSLSPSAVTVPITRPVEGGRYSSYFGYRNNPITHQSAFHTGLDIAVPLGTKIRGGTVRQVGEDERSGKYVTISHDDGFETFYCHCSEILVPRGTVVRAGEAVACVGSTGWSTGPHLHFEIRKDGTKLDPLQILEHDD